MTKSERLMHEIEMMRRPRGVSIEELQKTFGVSERTIFRDLSFLSELNVPVYFDGAYHVADQFSIRSAGLDYVDIELVIHSLACSPLMEYPALADRCREIMSALRRQQPPTARKEHQRLLKGGEKAPVKKKLEDSELLAVFLDALSQRCMIELTTTSNRQARVYVPVAIRMQNKEISLLVTGKARRSVRTITLSSVGKLRQTDVPFSRRPLDLLKD